MATDVGARQSTAEQVAELIRQRIERGLLVPGQRISQREIAEAFSTSTTPVREAFQVLQAQGFVRIDLHRGAVVASPSPAEIRENYEVRKALEALAVARAVEKLTAADFKRLRRLQAQILAAGTRAARSELNREFHAQLYAAARMPLLARLIEQLRAAVSYYLERAYDTTEGAEVAVFQHERILAACQAGDPERAAQAVRDHLELTAAVAVESAREMKSRDAPVGRPAGRRG